MNFMLGRVLHGARIVRRATGSMRRQLALGVGLCTLRAVSVATMALDAVLLPSIRTAKGVNPIVVTGNPRSGTTFLHRFLVQNGVGAGTTVFGMLFPSVLARRVLWPLFRSRRHVSLTSQRPAAIHESGLHAVETEDAALFLHYYDGFMLFAFLLALAERDLRAVVDPEERPLLIRDYAFLARLWRRTGAYHKTQTIIGRMFSVGATMPAFLEYFPDARVIYVARDPTESIPSTLSLVTHVLKERHGTALPDEQLHVAQRRLYETLVELLLRFTADWQANRISRERVFIVRYDDLIHDFESTVARLTSFLALTPSMQFRDAIRQTDREQRVRRSVHEYSAALFGLDKAEIERDCEPFIRTFLV